MSMDVRAERDAVLGQAGHRGRGGAGVRGGVSLRSGGDLSDVVWGLGLEREQVVEAACEVALEAAERSLFGFAFGFLARQVSLGGRVVAGAGDGDDVQRVVELAVAAAVKPVAVALPRGARNRCGAGLAGEARVASESLRAGGPADQERCGQRAAADLGEQLRPV